MDCLVVYQLPLLLGLAWGLSESGVPCYLHPAGDNCHYTSKVDSEACTTPADRARLSEGVRQVNRTLASLEQQLIRLGVIPPDNACSELPAVTNGGIIYSDLNLAPGCTGRYICDEGYMLYTQFDRKEFKCTEDGVWDGEVTEVPVYCQMAVERCEAPQEIVNGNITFKDDDPSNVLSGDMITYTCDPGTELIGSPHRYCLRNGNWSGTEPVCEVANIGPGKKESKANGWKVIIESVGGVLAGIVFGTVLIIVVVLVVTKGLLPKIKKDSRRGPQGRIFSVSNESIMEEDDSSQYRPILSNRNGDTTDATNKEKKTYSGKQRSPANPIPGIQNTDL